MALLGANPHVPEGVPVPLRLASIPGTVPPPGSWPSGCRFATRCQFAQPQCHEPFAVLPAHDGGLVRCVRVDELAHDHVTWDADDTADTVETRHALGERQVASTAPARSETSSPTPPTAGVSS
jgi:peptide/nickel transport system permease protein